MTARSTSDDTQAMIEKFLSTQSGDSAVWKETFLRSWDSLRGSQQDGTMKSSGSTVPDEFLASLPSGFLESTESSEFFTNLLKSGASSNFRSGSSLSSEQLQALFLNATSKGIERSRSTAEVPNLNSSAWLPQNPAIDNDAVSKTILRAETSMQFPSLLQSQSSNASMKKMPAKPQGSGGTNWFQLYDSGLPPSAIPPPPPPPVAAAQKEVAETLAAFPLHTAPPHKVASIARKSEKRNGKSKKRPKSRSRPEPKNKVFVQVRDEDVLCGRGGKVNHHPGNQRYLKQKDMLQERYMAADKNEKTFISQELVDIVHSWGGRFLQLEPGTEDSWFEVLNIVARKKASQSLREINTPEVRAAKRAKYAK